MTNSVHAPLIASRSRFSLSFLAVTLLTFLAASSAPTPLYRLYQEAWGFSSSTLTLIFAVYAFSLLAALLIVGSLSDYLGRRPVIFLALVLEIISIGLFIDAQSVAWLLAARLLQGFATGIATSSLGAALLDHDRTQGPLINSIAPMFGMACGALGTSILVEYAPQPLRLAYVLVFAALLIQAVLLWRLPESVSAVPGALASLRPALSVPPQTRRTLLRILPANVAVWSVGGFFLSLSPSLIRAATGSPSAVNGGLAVATLTISGAVAMLILRTRPPGVALRVGAGCLVAGMALLVGAIHGGWLWLFFLGALVVGCGFGSGFLGAVRSLMPLALPHERAGLMATFYVLSYLAFCLPALVAGVLIHHFGLIPTSYGYAAYVIALALLALLGLAREPVAIAANA